MSAVSLAACYGGQETERAELQGRAGESPIDVAPTCFNSENPKIR